MKGSGPSEGERDVLRARLGSAIERGAGVRWTDDEFNDLALAVFRFQARANTVYGRFVANRDLDPERVDDWRRIPPVPTRAFKELPLVCGDPERVDTVFRTSGTTTGTAARGEHRVRDLSLYRASLLAGASHFLRPELDGRAAGPAEELPLRVVALLPSPEARGDSSLVHMAGVLMEAWDDGGGGFFASADWSLDTDRIGRTLVRAGEDQVPVLVIGTAFALVHWLDRPGARREIVLPPGSLLMETGGYKGRSRSVPRAELYRELERGLGLPMARMVNEYGMTELLSQFYEPVLRGGAVEPGHRQHEGPPWIRTQVLDPADLSPAPPGTPGILCHLDLANLDSVCCVLTEDMGVALEDGGVPRFRLLGRTEGAEPRGCSLVMEELLPPGGGREW